jgi:hypothetical protein
VFAGLRMLEARLFQAVLLFFLSPVAQEVLSQLLDMFQSQLLGFIGCGSLRDGLIHHVSDALQSRIDLGTGLETFVKRTPCCIGWQFMFHELLYLNIFSKSTRQILPSIDGVSFSQPPLSIAPHYAPNTNQLLTNYSFITRLLALSLDAT